MNGRLIHFLLLGCGLLLALPPAWCCYPVRLSPAPQSEPTPAACCHKPQAPEPAPPAPVRCPCDDRNTVTSAGPEKVAVDLSLPALLTLVVPDSPRVGPPADAAPTTPVASAPL